MKKHIIAMLTAGLYALLLTGTPLARAADALRKTYVVEPLSRDSLSFTLSGKVENIKPYRYRPNLGGVPIKWVRFDGENVEVGDKLIEFDTAVLDKWTLERECHKMTAEAKLLKQQRANAQKLTDLALKRKVLEADRENLLKQIAATHAKDESERQILMLQIEQAEFAIAAARRNLNRVSALAAEGALGQHIVQQARERHERAVQAARVPRLALEVFDSVTGSAERELLELDLAATDLELGNTPGGGGVGVFGEIESLQTLNGLQGRVGNAEARKQERVIAACETMRRTYIMSAGQDGTFVHNPYMENGLAPGLVHHDCDFGFVFKPEDSAVDFFVAETARHLLSRGSSGTGPGERQAALLRIPAVPGQTFRSHVTVIGSVSKESEKHGTSGFTCRVELEDDAEELKAGMTVEVELQVPASPDFVAIPMWLVEDPLRPEVVLHDGKRRPIEGFVLGTRFVVTEGLQAGDSLLLPWESPPERTIRVSGKLRPRRYTPISWEMPRPYHWWTPYIYTDLVPDNTPVHKGDLLASAAAEGYHFKDRVYESDYQKIEAETMLAVARLEAQSRLLKAFVSWQKKELAARKARVNYLLQRYVSYEIQETVADVAQQDAKLMLHETEREAAQATADTTGFLSRHQKSERKLEHELAEIAFRQKTLNSVAALRTRDWLQVRHDESTMFASRLAAYGERLGYSAARAAYEVDMMRAQEAFREGMRQYEENLQFIVRSKLYAPRDGRVFYCPWQERFKPHEGGNIGDGDAMLMVDGNEWLFDVEVPARFYRHMKAGNTMEFIVPSLGNRPRIGEIDWVAPYLQPAENTQEERELRGSVGVPEIVFKLRIAFTAEGKDTELITPGLTAYLDLPREWEATP